MNIDPLIVDIYVGDNINQAKLTELAQAGRPWCGAIAKATEGTREDAAFVTNWPAIRAAGGPRYSIDWFRGAYHFLRFNVDAHDQAESYLDAIAGAGGWDVGDLWPIIDVERGATSVGVTRTQVEQGVRTWATSVTRATGRAPMLYAGEWFYELGITDRLGCQLLWVPRYASSLPATTYTRLGWPLSRVWGWQYRGVPSTTPDAPEGYPTTTPIGSFDLTAMIINGGPDQELALEWTRTHNGSNPS